MTSTQTTTQVYTAATSATAPVAGPALDRKHLFAWTTTSSGAPADPYVSPQLEAEIREAMAAVERGETEDLGSFAQYADDDED